MILDINENNKKIKTLLDKHNISYEEYIGPYDMILNIETESAIDGLNLDISDEDKDKLQVAAISRLDKIYDSFTDDDILREIILDEFDNLNKANK